LYQNKYFASSFYGKGLCIHINNALGFLSPTKAKALRQYSTFTDCCAQKARVILQGHKLFAVRGDLTKDVYKPDDNHCRLQMQNKH